jgi:hypothetical protein
MGMKARLITAFTVPLGRTRPVGSKLRRCRSAATILGILAAVLFPWLTSAVELTEPQGAAHAYPALLDTSGKKLADGEFKQWIEEDRLRVEIDYEFHDGQHFEESAVFRQKPELIQEKWSWKESKNGKISRQFTADFQAKAATALTHENNEAKQLSENIEVEPGRTFAGFGFTLALQNLRKRLINGEKVELKAVGFTPKPRLATVQVSYGGLDRMRMSGRSLKGDRFVIHPEIPPIAKLFIDVPDTQIWLTNPPPAGFLRWEGPVVVPSDPLIRVDLVPGAKSGPAEPVKTSSRN